MWQKVAQDLMDQKTDEKKDKYDKVKIQKIEEIEKLSPRNEKPMGLVVTPDPPKTDDPQPRFVERQDSDEKEDSLSGSEIGSDEETKDLTD